MRCWGEFGPWQFLQLGQPWKRLPSSKELAIFWKSCWSFDSLGCFLLLLWCRQRIHLICVASLECAEVSFLR